MTEIQGLVAQKTAALEEMLTKKAEMEKAITEEAKVVFGQVSKEIFEQYGDKVGLFGWEQYTPYFNDGEPCEFGKHEVFIYSPDEVANSEENGGDVEINYYESTGIFGTHSNEKYHYRKIDNSDSWYGDVWEWEPYNFKKEPEKWEKFENPNYDPELSVSDAKEAVNNLCKLIDEDTALALFGDHALVLVTPSGVEVEEAQHD